MNAIPSSDIRSSLLLVFAVILTCLAGSACIEETQFLIQSTPRRVLVVATSLQKELCHTRGGAYECTKYLHVLRDTLRTGEVVEYTLPSGRLEGVVGSQLPVHILRGASNEVKVHSVSSLFANTLVIGFLALTTGICAWVSFWLNRSGEDRAWRFLRSGLLSDTFRRFFGGSLRQGFSFAGAPVGLRVAFTISAFSMFAKMAKVDSKVTAEEIEFVDRIIREHFQFDSHARKVATQVFRHARTSGPSLRDHAVEFERIFHREPRLLREMLQILRQLAASDGEITPDEDALLREAGDVFGISSERFQSYNRESSRVRGSLNAYDILGLPSGAPLSEVKRAYRRLAKEYHPDTLLARGMPPEMIRVAADKFRKIQGAYEEVCRLRSGSA